MDIILNDFSGIFRVYHFLRHDKRFYHFLLLQDMPFPVLLYK